jgi:integrase
MAENKLTDKHLRNLKPTEKEQLIGDGGGLWVRVLPADKGAAINFYYRFEFDGKERRYNCGSYPDTPLALARENRNAARSLAKSGIDPVQKEENDRITRAADFAKVRMEKTVEELFDDWKRVYLVAHRKDKGKAAEDSIRRDVLPVIGSMKAKDIKLQHIAQVIDRILERDARRTANMSLSLMRQMFRHGLGRGIVETDPTLGLSRNQAGGKESPRERNLSCDEIRDLRTKLPLSGVHESVQAAIWLILATGVRVGELVKARWADIDDAEKTWTIPRENAKNDRQHLIHLSAFALKQLSVLRNLRSGDYLLTGSRLRKSDGGEVELKHVSEKTLSKAIRDRVRTEALKNRSAKTGSLLLSGGEWSPHDLRRTMASRMGDLEIEQHIIERCLNHIQQGIVGVYQKQEYLKERKEAFDKWGRQLQLVGKSANKSKGG